MRRTLEKLAQKRKEKEGEFAKKLNEIKEKSKEDPPFKPPLRLKQLLSQLEETFKSEDRILINQQILLILKEFQSNLEQSLNQMKEVLTSLTDLIELNASLADTKDREWDALGSNHVGMIFKSMEWRVDKLAAEYGDVKILMKKFLLLKEKLNELLSHYRGQREELIPILQEAQEQFGYLSSEVMLGIARFLRLTENTVFGVATFYAQFRFAPAGRRMLRLCRGTACHVRGAPRILDEVERRLGIKLSDTTDDLEYSLETIAA